MSPAPPNIRKCRACHGRGKLGRRTCPTCEGRAFLLVAAYEPHRAPKYGPEAASRTITLRIPGTLHAALERALAHGETMNALAIEAARAALVTRPEPAPRTTGALRRFPVRVPPALGAALDAAAAGSSMNAFYQSALRAMVLARGGTIDEEQP